MKILWNTLHENNGDLFSSVKKFNVRKTRQNRLMDFSNCAVIKFIKNQELSNNLV